MPRKKASPIIEPTINDLITFEEAAELSGFTTRHLRKLDDEKKLWAKKLGRNWFTTKDAINTYLSTERKPGRKPKKPIK